MWKKLYDDYDYYYYLEVQLSADREITGMLWLIVKQNSLISQQKYSDTHRLGIFAWSATRPLNGRRCFCFGTWRAIISSQCMPGWAIAVHTNQQPGLLLNLSTHSHHGIILQKFSKIHQSRLNSDLSCQLQSAAEPIRWTASSATENDRHRAVMTTDQSYWWRPSTSTFCWS